MTTPTPSSTTTPTPATTAIPVPPPAPTHRTVGDRLKDTRERFDHLIGKIRIYPVEISNRQHVFNLIVGVAALIIMGAFLISFALANPDSSSRYSVQAFSGRAGLVIGIGVIVLALYSGFWLVKRKAWHAVVVLAIIALVVLVVLPVWLRLMIGLSRLIFPATVVGVCAGVVSLALTIYIVIRLGATTSYDQELQDAQTAVTDKEEVLRLKQAEVDNAQAQIVPMQTTKANAEAAEAAANQVYDDAVKDREEKEKIRNKFVNKKDKTVPAAQTQLDRAKLDYSNTRDKIDPLKKALNFAGTKDDLLPEITAAVEALVTFDNDHPAPLTNTLDKQRDVLNRKAESWKRLDTLLAQLATLDKAVKAAEKNLIKVTKLRDKKPEVANYTAALKLEQKASKERDKKKELVKEATDKLNAKVLEVGELKAARDTFVTERDELQSTADTIEADLGTKTRKFLFRLAVAALLAAILIAGFAR